MRATPTLVILLGLIACPGARAQEAGRVSLFQTISFDEPQPEESGADRVLECRLPYKRYGGKDTQSLMFGLMVGPDFSGNVDTNIHGQYTYFLIDDFEVGVEAAFWTIFQEDDTVGASSSLVMRYHFFHAERWSAFGEVGMGLILTGDNVPDTGTSFSLMPRVGAGVTFKIFDYSNTRLITGLRWHHISNARISGEAKNPARDGVGLYVGLLFEF